jgi:hypothetical protein
VSETGRAIKNATLHWLLPTWAPSFEQRGNSSGVRGDGKKGVGPDSTCRKGPLERRLAI